MCHLRAVVIYLSDQFVKKNVWPNLMSVLTVKKYSCVCAFASPLFVYLRAR